jgi:hypothetical protein
VASRSSQPPLGTASKSNSGRALVKGVAFRTVVWSVEQLYGAHQVSAALAEMRQEPRDALHYGELVSGSWYPVTWYADLLQAVVRTNPGEADVVRKIAELSIERDVKGVYRFLVEHLDPTTVVSLCSKLFPRYYTPGKMLVTREGPTQFQLRIEGCVGFSALMWQEVYASGKHLLALSGASNIRVFIAAGGKDGDSHIAVDARWGDPTASATSP